MRHRTLLATVTLLLAALPVRAELVALEVHQRIPFAEGKSFGDTGPYDRITGIARFEVDPAHPRNKEIVDLEKAPRNARGRVEFAADVCLLVPHDPAKGNGKLLYEVNNRGRKFLPHWLMDAGRATNDPKTAADAGNGLFLRLGYTIVWSGWDPDAPRANAGMAMQVPLPEPAVVRTIRDELVNGTRGPLRDAFALSYPAASLDPALTASIMDLLRRINAEHGITLIVSQHQLETALAYTTRVVGLRRGRVRFDGPPAAVTPAVVEAIYGDGA